MFSEAVNFNEPLGTLLTGFFSCRDFGPGRISVRHINQWPVARIRSPGKTACRRTNRGNPFAPIDSCPGEDKTPVCFSVGPGAALVRASLAAAGTPSSLPFLVGDYVREDSQPRQDEPGYTAYFLKMLKRVNPGRL